MSDEPPISADERAELERFPAPLRTLVLAEIAAGNAIAELGHGFPAAPCGAWARLSRPVSTRPRATCPELRFFDRNGPEYSGEFTDAKRHFFVLEPPREQEPAPRDLSAYMESLRSGGGGSIPSRGSAPPAEVDRIDERDRRRTAASLVDRFRASMILDYDRWHDGIGYDIALLKDATPAERTEIEREVLRRGVDDWRDVEALAALDSPTARERLRAILVGGSLDLACAVLAHAPDLVADAERTTTLVAALERLEFGGGGLTQAMLLVEEHHPPPVVDALIRGVLTRDGGVAYHFASMLLFIHGVVASRWDMTERPFLLTLTTADPIVRLERFRLLCTRLGLDPESVLRRIGHAGR